MIQLFLLIVFVDFYWKSFSKLVRPIRTTDILSKLLLINVYFIKFSIDYPAKSCIFLD